MAFDNSDNRLGVGHIIRDKFDKLGEEMYPGMREVPPTQPDDGINLTPEGQVARERQRVLFLQEKVGQAERVNAEQYNLLVEERTKNAKASASYKALLGDRDNLREELNRKQQQLNDLATELRFVKDILVKEAGYTPEKVEREGVVATVREVVATQRDFNPEAVIAAYLLDDYLDEQEVQEFGLRQVLHQRLEEHKNWAATVRVTGPLIPTLAYQCADGWVRVAPGHYNELTSALRARNGSGPVVATDDPFVGPTVAVSGGAGVAGLIDGETIARRIAEDHGERFKRLEDYLVENWPLHTKTEPVEDAIYLLELVRTNLPGALRAAWHDAVVPALRTLAKAGYDMSGMLGSEAKRHQDEDDS